MAEKKQKNTKEDIAKQVIALAADHDWLDLSLSEISTHLGMPLEDFHQYFEDKTDILVAFERMIDRQVMEGVSDIDPDMSARDQLFDIFMDRYEALNEYREGLVSILRSFKLDPKQAVISMPHLCYSMTTMLEASGVDTSGVSGAIKVAGATGVYLNTLRVWKKDESADLSKTMAVLDKDMGRAEQLANFMGL